MRREHSDNLSPIKTRSFGPFIKDPGLTNKTQNP